MNEAPLPAELEVSEMSIKEKAVSGLKQESALELINEFIIERLEILEENSPKFNEDSRMIAEGLVHILAEIDQDITAEELREARIAAHLHDIGKSGPAKANPEQSTSIARIFNIELPFTRESSSRSLSSVVQEYFDAHEESAIKEDLRSCGIDLAMTMRDFWDKHAHWTNEIIEEKECSLPLPIRIIAASHHIDKGINPRGIRVEDIPITASVIGTAEDYLIAMALLAIDKYQAALYRKNENGTHYQDNPHRHALEVTKLILGPKYTADATMQKVLSAIDRLGQEGRIFQSEK